MLRQGQLGLVAGGEDGTFTPMYFERSRLHVDNVSARLT